MSISTAVRRVIRALLPQECLLCGADAGDAQLCTACADELPVLPEPRCPVCALPTPGGGTCGQCLKSPPAFDATLALWRYDFPLDKLVQALKYRHHLSIAGFFAERMAAGPRPAGDLMIPVPLSARRLQERGFNQALEIARPLARATGMDLGLDFCRRTLDTVPQASLPWKERRKNVRHAFECTVDLDGRHVVVVDDVMTTGATLEEFARTLKRHGAAKVGNWVVARALRD